MAIYFNGMSEAETAALTECMANSGDKIDLSVFGNLSCDKHSTGRGGGQNHPCCRADSGLLRRGGGKMSGKGLGHTGGTIDKLESIRGYNSSLSGG